MLFEINFNVLNINVSECTNGELPNGATDEKGNDCSYFNPTAGHEPTTQCGQYDDDDFKAHKMCCECKNSSKCLLSCLLRYTGGL